MCHDTILFECYDNARSKIELNKRLREMKKKRHVFCISDGTGITATMLSNSLLSQFEHTEFILSTHPYIDHEDKARDVVLQIKAAFAKDHESPLVFTTIVKPDISCIIQESPGLVFDFFDRFI